MQCANNTVFTRPSFSVGKCEFDVITCPLDN